MHVQADEIRVKARGMVVWMGLAIMVSTRLWVGGVISRTRDSSLADRLLKQVRACSTSSGRDPHLYRRLGSVSGEHTGRHFQREGQTESGAGARSIVGLVGLHIGTVIKHTVKETAD